eukprot:2871408-Pyramimonas_sp.AAC.1
MEGGVEFHPAEVAAQKKVASAAKDPVRLTTQGMIDDPLSVERQARDVAGRAQLWPLVCNAVYAAKQARGDGPGKGARVDA